MVVRPGYAWRTPHEEVLVARAVVRSRGCGVAARRPSVGVDPGTSTTLIASTQGSPIGHGTVWMPWSRTTRRAPLVANGPVESSGSGRSSAGSHNRDFVGSTCRPARHRIDDLIVELLREPAAGAGRSRSDAGGGAWSVSPARRWDVRQRRRLLTAAQRADLPVVLATMQDEPVAAGIAWLHKTPPWTVHCGWSCSTWAAVPSTSRCSTSAAATSRCSPPRAWPRPATRSTSRGRPDLEAAKVGIDIDAGQPPPGRVRLLEEARATSVPLSGPRST